MLIVFKKGRMGRRSIKMDIYVHERKDGKVKNVNSYCVQERKDGKRKNVNAYCFQERKVGKVK